MRLSGQVEGKRRALPTFGRGCWMVDVEIDGLLVFALNLVIRSEKVGLMSLDSYLKNDPFIEAQLPLNPPSRCS